MAAFKLNERHRLLCGMGGKGYIPTMYSSEENEFFSASLYVWYLKYWALCDYQVTFELYTRVNSLYHMTSGSEITPCNKIDQQLVVYRYTENVMTSITTLRT